MHTKKGCCCCFVHHGSAVPFLSISIFFNSVLLYITRSRHINYIEIIVSVLFTTENENICTSYIVKTKRVAFDLLRMKFALVFALVFCAGLAPLGVRASDWASWLSDFGHDTFQYPAWVSEQQAACRCTLNQGKYSCEDERLRDRQGGDELTWCVAKEYLLNHMPEFDKHYMPPSVSVDGNSMFDDNIAFALMASNASKFSRKIPLAIRLPYILPYANYHEARVNWRPLFFAKYFKLVENAESTVEAMSALVAPNVFLNWTGNLWEAHPSAPHQSDYTLEWSSSTSPPIINPFSFAAYGYASCSGWATFVSYMARAMGVPARQVGTPCWNSVYAGTDFRGLAKDNPNVSVCWHGGIGSKSGKVGGGFLNNHNWVEYYDDEEGKWVFQNVPPQSTEPDSPSLCDYNETTGCNHDPKTGCSAITGGPGAAAEDHEIFAVTWSEPHTGTGANDVDGGPVLDVKDLKLSNGEPVSPLVWSPRLSSPTGEALKDIGLRVVNRTEFYRCKDV